MKEREKKTKDKIKDKIEKSKAGNPDTARPAVASKILGNPQVGSRKSNPNPIIIIIRESHRAN